jgi:intracellular sulfur oxidation DsrE/DsrF family protein
MKWRRDVGKRTSGRRNLIAGLGTTAAAVALGTRTGTAQAQTAAFQPARHSQDDWFATRPGKHRVVLDTTSPAGLPDAIRFADNLFNASKSGYGIEETELAIVICLRHRATGYGYTDVLWSKYGRVLGRVDDGTNTGTQAPTSNPYDSGNRPQLSTLAKRGVHFMVCGTASRALARGVAGQNGDAEAVFKEFEANLIPNAHIVTAGVVGVTHAQEFGYSYLFVG